MSTQTQPSEHETDENDIVSVVETNTELLYSQDRALIDMQIATAKQYPRNVAECIEEAIAVATMDAETAVSCNYTIPRANKIITGGSVHLAKILVQTWGNIKAGARVVATDDKHVISQAICYDLQKNVSITLEVKRSIVQNEYKNGQRTGNLIRMSDEMITITGNACNSIALRNAIFSVIPKNVVGKVYQSAIEVITGDVSTDEKLAKRRAEVFEFMRTAFGVTDSELLKFVGKTGLRGVTKMDLVALYGVAQAIRDNETSIETAFRPGKKRPTAKDPEVAKAFQETQRAEIKKAVDKFSEQIKPDDRVWIDKVIKNKTVGSYTKTLLFLEQFKTQLK